MQHLDRLNAFLARRERTAFAYGPEKHDCASFAASAVAVQTGRNPLKRLGLKWRDKDSAARLIANAGGLDKLVDQVLERITGYEGEDWPAGAHRGDIGLVDGLGGPALVVIEGVTLVGPGPDGGLQRLDRLALKAAWKVRR